MSWTPEKEEKLKKLWRKGHTASQISSMLGDTTRNAVIGKAHRLNLEARAISTKFKSKVNTPFAHTDTRILSIPRHIPKATNEEMLRTQRFMNYAELAVLESDTFEVDLY